MASFFDNKARAAAAAASSSKAKTDAVVVAPRLQPWVEKYRPKNLDEVKSQDHVSSILKKMVHASNLPHLLLYGPPGTGKTSSILALCRELFPPELFPSRVLELNASDERGITVVREKIKNFAQQAVTHAPANTKFPCPPFKIIILDEADSLTQDSQSALRRVMENYAKTCRMVLCCNFVTRIIDPISSRCSKFRFKPLDGADARARIAEILAAEHVLYEDGVVEQTLKLCEGDLRKGLQLLQSAARLVGAGAAGGANGSAAKPPKKNKTVIEDEDEEMTDADAPKPSGKAITSAIINEIAGIIPPETIDELIQVLNKGNKMNYNNIARAVENLVADGWACSEVLGSLYTKLVFDDLVESREKNRLTLLFSEADKRLVDGVEEHLLMLDMCCQIAEILSTK